MPDKRCPTCNGPVPAPSADAPSSAPFCSARCKLVDLSRWLNEEYAVPGPALGDGHDAPWDLEDDAPRH